MNNPEPLNQTLFSLRDTSPTATPSQVQDGTSVVRPTTFVDKCPCMKNIQMTNCSTTLSREGMLEVKEAIGIAFGFDGLEDD